MINEEFVNETSKMERFYGKELSEEQQKIWFENLKKISVERYRCIIGALYRKNKYFPSLADIIQLNNELGMKQKETKYKEEKCDICSSRGVIRYIKKINGIDYDYYCKCHCLNSNKYNCFPTMEEVGLSEEIILKSRTKKKMSVEEAKKIVQNFYKTEIFKKV